MFWISYFQLKIYAVEQTIAAKIDDSYNAQVHTLRTLGDFHLGSATSEFGEHVTNYTLSLQVIFPFIMVVFFVLLFVHIFDKFDIYSIRNRLQTEDNGSQNHFVSASPSTNNLWIISLAFASYAFVMYVIVLDSIAVGFRYTHVKKEIYYDPKSHTDFHNKVKQVTTNNADNSSVNDLFQKLQIEYSIPTVMLVYDTIVILLLAFFPCFFIGKHRCNCPLFNKWHYILLGPISCIAIHSYHIILGFIHNPEHAASIAVFYGIVVILFIVTIRIVYTASYTFLYRYCEHDISAWNEHYKSELGEEENSKTCRTKCFSCCCCIYSRRCKGPHPYVWLILALISSLSAGFIVYVVVIYVINPVNEAIEGAPGSLVSINQTVLLFVGAAVAYRVFRDDESTVLALLVKAMNKATTSMFPKQQKNVHAAANQLSQAAAKQRVQKATQNLLKTAITNLIDIVRVNIDEYRQTTADHQVRDAAYLLIQHKVDEFFKRKKDQWEPNKFEVNEKVRTSINNVFEALFQLIKTIIDQGQNQRESQKIIQAVASSLGEDVEQVQEKVQNLKKGIFTLVQVALKQYITCDLDSLVQEINTVAVEFKRDPEHNLIKMKEKEKFLNEIWTIANINEQEVSNKLVIILQDLLNQIAEKKNPCEFTKAEEKLINSFIRAKILGDKLQQLAEANPEHAEALRDVANDLQPQKANNEDAPVPEKQLEVFIPGIGMHMPPIISDHLVQAVLRICGTQIENHFIEAVRQGSNGDSIVNFKKVVLGLVTDEITTAAKSDALLTWGLKNGQEKKETMSSYLLEIVTAF